MPEHLATMIVGRCPFCAVRIVAPLPSDKDTWKGVFPCPVCKGYVTLTDTDDDRGIFVNKITLEKESD